MPPSPLERLRATAASTTAALPSAIPRPGAAAIGVAAIHVAALDVVGEAVPAARLDALIDAYGDRWLREAALAPDPAITALLTLPLPDDLADALRRLGEPPAAHAQALQDRSWFAGALPPLGMSAVQQADLLARLAAGASADDVLRGLAPLLLHEVISGPARPWSGGWPAWTLIEAASTAVHQKLAPEHIFPAEPGGALPAYRHFALIGAALRAWVGDEGVLRIARSAHADEVWGELVGAALRLADLQAWMARGGAHLGPAYTDPLAWVKLIDAVFGGGPLDDLLARVEGPVTPALAASVPDLLTAALAVPWSQLASWSRSVPGRAAAEHEAAVAAMFVEDLRGQTLVAMPSDPPGGELVLDVADASLTARPRAHHQYTEPARWILDPAWCASLAERGVERVTFSGCTWERRDALLRALAGIEPDGAVMQVHVGPAEAVPTPASASQLRPPDPVLVLGGSFGHALGERLAEKGLGVCYGPFGATPDPLSTARALAAAASEDPFSPNDLVGTGPWTGRWHDPTLQYASRSAAVTDLQRRLAESRSTAAHARLVLLTWQTAWGLVDAATGEVTPGGAIPRLLQVDEVVEATREALVALRQRVGPAQVVLAIDPSREPDGIADRQSKAVLTLAAARLAAEQQVEVFHALEIVHDELRDRAWYAPDGLALSDAAVALLQARFLGGWVAPVARERVVAPPASMPPDEHPSDPPEGAPPKDDEPGSSALDALLAARTTLSVDDEPAWAVQLDDALDALPALPGGAAAHLDALRALSAAIADLGDPELLAAPYARLLRGLVPCGAWTVGALAPLLHTGLAHHWTDGLVDELSALPPDVRAALGEALLQGAARPRRGQIARTPMHKALVALLGSA